MAEDKMENGYELWLKCCDNTKSGEVRRFLEVPITEFSAVSIQILHIGLQNYQFPFNQVSIRPGCLLSHAFNWPPGMMSFRRINPDVADSPPFFRDDGITVDDSFYASHLVSAGNRELGAPGGMRRADETTHHCGCEQDFSVHEWRSRGGRWRGG